MQHRPFRRRLARLGLGLLLGATAAGVQAQAWPTKTIRIIVPSPPGGTLDIVGRFLAESLQPVLGQQLIIDNKAGAAGMIGVGEMLKAPHDGYTVMMHISGVVSEIPHIIKPPYDPFRDIKPLVELGRSGLVFVAAASFPVQNLKEVIANVKANPSKTNYGSYSPGTISHTLGIELNRLAGLDLNHIGYKGSPPALQDLMGGAVQLMFDGPVTSLPLIQSGRIKAIAVTSPQRMAALPSVPTFQESGYPSLSQLPWIGLWAPSDVPAPVQARLREAAIQVLQQPRFRERLLTLGMEPGQGASSEELAKSLQLDHERHGALLKSIDFKPQ